MVYLQYFHNKSYVTGYYLLLLVDKKSNFNSKFKLKTYNNLPTKI